MNIEMLSIGDELLSGMRRDGNAPWLALFLRGKGLGLSQISVLPDSRLAIQQALGHALERSDVLFLSGGLGPTEDDLTKGVLGDFFGLPLEDNAVAKALAQDHYRRLSRKWKPQNRYHLIPRGLLPVFNPKGLAPGLAYHRDGKFVLAAPGVPREFSAMVEEEFFPYLEKNAPSLSPKGRGSLPLPIFIRTRGIPEEKIFFELVPQLWRELSRWGKVSSFPNPLGVDIVITPQKREGGEGKEEATRDIQRILAKTPLAPHVWQIGNKDLNEWVLERAKKKGVSIGLAESCTGGLLASHLTDIPGSSEVFAGSMVAYSSSLKEKMLGVFPEDLKKHGAISLDVATKMAEEVLTWPGVDVALSLTGIAGPGGGSEAKPVGTLAMAYAYRGREVQGELISMKSMSMGGNWDRLELKERFTKKALFTLLDIIEKL